MRRLLPFVLICMLALPVMAQRRGGGGMGGRGFAFSGGRAGAGFNRGFIGFNRGSGFKHGFRFNRGFVGFHRGSRRNFFGFGNFGFIGGFAGYPYAYPPYPYDYGYPYYGVGYAAAPPNVVVVYPPPAAEPQTVIYSERPPVPVMREYDSTGQETKHSTSSPIYLIGFKGGMLHAASSYRVEGRTIYYTTLEGEAKEASLDSLDRSLTMQIDRNRRVLLQLPE